MKWTIQSANRYVETATYKGLKYWSAIDFLNGKGVEVKQYV